MNAAMPMKQRGFSFGGFVFGAFLLVLASITALKLIPAYMQYAKINNVFTVITHDPEMQKASPREIRNSFDKRASIDAITAIKSDEIEITSEGGNLVLSSSYAVKVPLLANISLLLEFTPSSDR
ncbi:MAG: DUF4845 domain-containing protein [Gallionella sp.]